MYVCVRERVCVCECVCVCVMDGWICLECSNKRPIDHSIILYSTIDIPPGFTALKVFDPKEGMAAVLISSSVDNKIRLWNIDSGRLASDGVIDREMIEIHR